MAKDRVGPLADFRSAGVKDDPALRGPFQLGRGRIGHTGVSDAVKHGSDAHAFQGIPVGIDLGFPTLIDLWFYLFLKALDDTNAVGQYLAGGRV